MMELKMKNRIIFIIGFLFLSILFSLKPEFALAVLNKHEIGALFDHRFDSIVFDTRGDRGGQGDVAASYLTINEILNKYSFTGEISIIVSDKSQKIIHRLADGNTQFFEKVHIFHEIQDADAIKMKMFDLYVSLANPSGVFYFKDEFFGKINFKKHSVFISQTVLGNIENDKAALPVGSIQFSEISSPTYHWSTPGIDPEKNELGIYSDYVAQEYRNLTLQETQYKLAEENSRSEIHRAKKQLEDLIRMNIKSDIQIGLMYGISLPNTHDQLESYLMGINTERMKPESKNSLKPLVIITPSHFNKLNIKSDLLRNQIVEISKDQQILPDLDKYKIYVLETPTLSHRIFVGLISLSMKNGVVPLGAGDGFLSAAIELGGPFVLTKVAWNAPNIAALGNKLIEISSSSVLGIKSLHNLRGLIFRIYQDLKLEHSQDLLKYRSVFKNLRASVGDFTEALMRISITPRLIEEDPGAIIEDPFFRKNLRKGGSPPLIQRHPRNVETLFCSKVFN